MKVQIEQLSSIRNLICESIEHLDDEKLLKIPDGFSNNIYWNLAHILVVQQSLCYILNGIDPIIDDDLIPIFRSGTNAPEEFILERHKLIEYLRETPGQLLSDYTGGKFREYTGYTTSTGVMLPDFESAISFNHFHEGTHLGYILSLRKHV